MQPKQESGFALLVTIIVVGVVVAIGISILDLSIKQVRLTTTSRDSELAFHAANAGLECARFNRLSSASAMEVGAAVAPTCFSGASPATLDVNNRSTLVDGVDGQSFLYRWDFTWGEVTTRRCSRMSILVASTTPTGSGVTTPNMQTNFPGFEGATHFCEPSARCTVISVQGFNRPCGSVGLEGTVQREVLLQF